MEKQAAMAQHSVACFCNTPHRSTLVAPIACLDRATTQIVKLIRDTWRFPNDLCAIWPGCLGAGKEEL